MKLTSSWKLSKKNDRKEISYGGILTALDGPIRLSEGAIVMMTANSTEFLKGAFGKCLMRPGRIDVHFEF